MKTPLDHELPAALAHYRRITRDLRAERNRLRSVLATVQLAGTTALCAFIGAGVGWITDYATRTTDTDTLPAICAITGAVCGALVAIAAMVHLRGGKGGAK